MATKKPAKKATKKEASQEMDLSFWQLSNNAEEISMNIEQVREVLALVAESMFDSKSNVIWLAYDLLDKQVKALNGLAELLMEVHRRNAK